MIVCKCLITVFTLHHNHDPQHNKNNLGLPNGRICRSWKDLKYESVEFNKRVRVTKNEGGWDNHGYQINYWALLIKYDD